MTKNYGHLPDELEPPTKKWPGLKLALAIGLLLILIAIAILAVSAFVSLSTGQVHDKYATSPSPQPTLNIPGNPTATPQPVSSSFKVYFSKHPDSETNYQLVYPATRTSQSSAVAKAAFADLLAGPTSDEAQQGYYSSWKLSGTSSCNRADFSLSITQSTATLKLCKDFSSAGIGQDATAEAQANTTLTQFPTITKVVYLNKQGNCLFDASGQNQCLR